ncbi:CRISPR-associated helicase Cas3' [Kitasatospora sp. NPDC004723]|uniref:CRISPR-associated helicase Cas3' n=1 Tax=Kitasatospora sp. NPDC004723 TaxID=3154288 RepID=UPI0033BD52E7
MTVDQPAKVPTHHAIWAKTDQRARSRRTGGPAWNPLTAHALDTAACVGQLWDRYLTPALHARFAEAFGAGNAALARRVVMLLAALHDLGKGSGCFLRKFGRGRYDDANLLRGKALRDWKELARAVDLPRDPDDNAQVDARHEHITAAHLPRLLGCAGEDCAGVGPCTAGLHAVALLLGGHHGHIPGAESVDRAFGAAPFERWNHVYRPFVAELAELIGVPLDQMPRLVRPERPSVLPLFAGLVILADWLASSEDHFAFRRLEDPPMNWWTASLREAEKAIGELLLDRWAPEPASWHDLFPGTEPRPFQVAALAALPRNGPALVIVESDTGSGKTRLAFAAAHSLALRCGHQGLFLAMPTRAATGQIGAELRAFATRASGGTGTAHLAVVHGGAEGTELAHRLLDGTRTPHQGVLEALHDSIEAGISTDTAPDRENGSTRVVLHPWYLRRCLGLVSTFGIGTVDQLALAPQRTRHWMLRLLGLAGKVVVIDEAHAYQLFQQRMLGAAVEWLADAGASVVVLSATLPSAVHRLLVEAWCTGQQRPLDDLGQRGPITVVDQTGVLTRAGAAKPSEPVRTGVRLAPDPGPERLARHLLAEGTRGGITSVIRNRADSAIELYGATASLAEQYGWGEHEIVLLHGRLMGRHRLPIEDRLIGSLGPGNDRARTNPSRPARLLVIATQIVEQSLDIDVDRMYTDLAPVDLLLQRRGRLWRHPANRTAEQGDWAPLTVLWHPDPAGLPIVEPPGNNDGLVYAPYTLAATWHALTRRRRNADGVYPMATPGHSRALVEEVYGDDGPTDPGSLAALLGRTRAAWRAGLDSEYAESDTKPFRPFGRSRTKPVKAGSLTSGRAHGDGDGDGGLATGAPGISGLSRLGEKSLEFLAFYRQAQNRLTYDRAGHLPVDGRYYADDAAERRRQQRDFQLNTLAIPARWVTDERAVPAPDRWPVIDHPALKYRSTALFHPRTGQCVSGPVGLAYDERRGYRR